MDTVINSTTFFYNASDKFAQLPTMSYEQIVNNFCKRFTEGDLRVTGAIVIVGIMNSIAGFLISKYAKGPHREQLLEIHRHMDNAVNTAAFVYVAISFGYALKISGII